MVLRAIILVVCLACTRAMIEESPVDESSQWWIETSAQENSEETSSDSIFYEFPTTETSEESEWSAYSSEMYPVFRNAVKELSASEHGILLFWDTLNRPQQSKNFFDQVFEAHNRLTTEDTVYSTTEEPSSETVDVNTDDSGTENHATTEEDEEVTYYATEDPSTVETLLTEEIYATTSPATQEETSDGTEHLFVTSGGDVYEETSAFEEEESKEDGQELKIAVSESDWENIVKRSGEMIEIHPAEPDTEEHCEECPLQVGSIRGIPGLHFPNYEDIPITSFSCADKHVPGFYADLETGCQVFHVCWPHRRESFLCPIGTLFNQAILTCDYWYSTNCSLSTHFFDLTTYAPEPPTPCRKPTSVPSYPTSTEAYEEPIEVPEEQPHVDLEWFRPSQFVPVKSKVTVYAKQSAKKPGLKYVVEQKHDVLPLVEEFLALTKNVAENAIKLVPKVKVVKTAVPKSKVARPVKVKPALKIKTRLPPLPEGKPQSLPHLDPRFIVRPAQERPVVHVKKGKLVVPKVTVRQIKPVDKIALKPSKIHAPKIVMKSLDVASNVLQRDILDHARQAIAESHVKSLKPKN